MPVQKPKKAPCNCKKSKCLKLYCECFASGGYCDESCNCLDCANTTEKEDIRQQAIAARLEKNPNAFKPKIGATPAMLTVTPGLQKSGAVRITCEWYGNSIWRIDRETWTKNFSSPFEASPGRERQRTELFRSRMRASTGSCSSNGGAPASSLSVRVRAVPFTSPRTPRLIGKSGAKRSRNLSPVMGQGEEQRSGGNCGIATLLKECELQQYVLTGKTSKSVGKASLSAMASSSAGVERVFVLPLFGEELPPLESGVSANIFRFLTNADLHNASLVSHLWNQVALGDTVWDIANFIPTETNVAAARRSRKKRRLEMPIKLEPGIIFISNSKVSSQIQDGAAKREPNLSVLSALR
ncbi:hypothetical protein JM18_007234 [Phytophthora kernoviae]|uniref:CRC domain-containing protein n=2 Tax=Phytophthora kernoviae TaxID=325452 RepID=A0A921SFF6_9STRA|nr:hypothetical protein G195_008732 [Phytophthora kernoviae 00238/432]KAG2520171.1 hypothetical protein JM18_007234 [Phytophthora kernoviae]